MLTITVLFIELNTTCFDGSLLSLWPGRFGVGFNSCYHLTDVVSFVSGRNLAIFDPHCSALPSVTAAEPGKRIDFVSNRVGDEYPDQFAPYQASPACRLAFSLFKDHAHTLDSQLFLKPSCTPD